MRRAGGGDGSGRIRAPPASLVPVRAGSIPSRVPGSGFRSGLLCLARCQFFKKILRKRPGETGTGRDGDVYLIANEACVRHGFFSFGLWLPLAMEKRELLIVTVV